MKIFSAADVHAALDWEPLAAALERAFVEGAEVPVRHAHALGPQDTLLLMPAWNTRVVVTKLVTVIPSAEHTVQATLMVCDRATGAPLALIDGEAVTLRRTAAASALAARRLARVDAARLLVVGTGRLAPWMARAHAALRPTLHAIQVWGRRAEAADAVAAELAAEGLDAVAVQDLEAAVRSADIVCCASTAREPVVRGEWVAAGAHLDLVGGFRPDMREVDDTAVARSSIVVDTWAGALSEAGDLAQPLERGVITRNAVLADLATVLAGQACVRRSAADITLFKSVGTALEDLAAAELVLQAAGRR